MKYTNILILSLFALCLFSSAFAQTSGGTSGAFTSVRDGSYVTSYIELNATVLVANATDLAATPNTTIFSQGISYFLFLSDSENGNVDFYIGSPVTRPVAATLYVNYTNPDYIVQVTNISVDQPEAQYNATLNILMDRILSHQYVTNYFVSQNLTQVGDWFFDGEVHLTYNGTANTTTTGATTGTSANGATASGTTTTSSSSLSSSPSLFFAVGVLAVLGALLF